MVDQPKTDEKLDAVGHCGREGGHDCAALVGVGDLDQEDLLVTAAPAQLTAARGASVARPICLRQRRDDVAVTVHAQRGYWGGSGLTRCPSRHCQHVDRAQREAEAVKSLDEAVRRV